MWLKYLAVFILFYFFAVLQNSFFAHFISLGALPNFIFILFFLLTYFEKNNYSIIYYAVLGGSFLDLFSAGYFGLSIILFLAAGFILKKIETLLKERQGDGYPFAYFLPLFFILFVIYDFILKFDFNLLEIICNLIIASAAFFIYKRFANEKLQS